MRLSTLLQHIVQLPPTANRDVTGLTLDSRRVKANDLFLAFQGTQQDGRRYIPDAIAKGAAAVLVDADENESVQCQNDVPLIPIRALQQQLGALAARFYDYPAQKLRMIGVTGTSGKTTCTHFIAQLLQQLGHDSGLIGTLGSGFYGELHETGLTTPDAIALQQTLQNFVGKGAEAIAMEVSSHSIDQGRVNVIPFEIGIFTNLTQDHLDYHGDMATYAAVKKRFFTEWPIKYRILNLDDPMGAAWLTELAKEPHIYAYSLQKPTTAIPTVYVDEMQSDLSGTRANVHTPWGSDVLSLPIMGRFNVSNALAVLTALCVYGIPLSVACRALSQLQMVPGRLQTLGGDGKPWVVVDYAHKPDALEKVLQTLREQTQGQLICVFGCGGDRDQAKRPLMAHIAERFADQVIVTNDNPRHEAPLAIAEQIMTGFTHPDRVIVQLDRAKAIEKSIELAGSCDCVLIAGKGAEHYQQIGDEKIPFDDVEHVLNCFEVAGVRSV